MAKQRQRRRVSKVEPKDQDIKYLDKKSKNVPHNDPDWYIYDKDMFEGVISMPTLEFKGTRTPWKSNVLRLTHQSSPAVNKIKEMADNTFKIPTVAVYKMNPGLENENNLTGSVSVYDYSAINVAARKIYAELSASNAKTSQYAPQDISTLILALGQIIAIAEHAKRLYGTLNHFNFYSKGIPSHIVKAMGITNYDTLKKNLSNFRATVNQIVTKIDTIQFPANLSYFKKCKYIYQNIFVDSDEKMITYHLMVPDTTWLIVEDAVPEGTILKTVNIYDNQYTTLLTKLEEMVENILTSSTFNYIFADILNLSNRNVLQVESLNVNTIPIDYVIEPIYSEQFNWQVMNMTIYPKANGTTGFVSTRPQYTPNNDVYPDVDNNKLKYSPLYLPSGSLREDKYTDLAKYTKTIPIRLPSTNVSDDMFVELLAYYGYCVLEGSGTFVDDPFISLQGIPDYYCTGMVIVEPGSISTTIPSTLSLNANCQPSSNWKRVALHNQIVHTPFIGMYDFTQDNPDIHPVSRMSAYTQVDYQAINNLRYQTYLGLMSFKR